MWIRNTNRSSPGCGSLFARFWDEPLGGDRDSDRGGGNHGFSRVLVFPFGTAEVHNDHCRSRRERISGACGEIPQNATESQSHGVGNSAFRRIGAEPETVKR